jgi:hypothetical protein
MLITLQTASSRPLRDRPYPTNDPPEIPRCARDDKGGAPDDKGGAPDDKGALGMTRAGMGERATLGMTMGPA